MQEMNVADEFAVGTGEDNVSLSCRLIDRPIRFVPHNGF
jgi:hypothetical protein